MASYSATVTSPHPPEQVFLYLADFRSVAEWDPSIRSCEHTNSIGPLAVGAVFRVSTQVAGRDVVIDYETKELEAPRKIFLRGENSSLVSLDTISIEMAPDGGSNVTYDAVIELKGALKLADPLLDLGFQRLGNQARDGLAQKLQNLS